MASTPKLPVRNAPPASDSTLRSARWRNPIQLQLLAPVLLLVLLTSIGATSATAIWIARGVQRQHRAELDRIVQTLTNSSFPFTQNVLAQLSGFANAQFVLADSQHRIIATTLTAGEIDPGELRSAAMQRARVGLTDSPRTVIRDEYVVDVLDFAARGPTDNPQSLFILRRADTLSRQLYAAVFPAIATGVIAMLVASAIATWLARRFVAPIRKIAEHAAEIAEGHFTPTGLPERGDELGDLARSIDAMALRLDAYSSQLRQMERMETLSKIGGAMAHQLRNCATGGRIAVELHQRECHQNHDDALSVALRQFQLMESRLRQYLSVDSNAMAAKIDDVDLIGVTTSTAALLQPMAAHYGIDWSVEFPSEAILLRADQSQMEQLLMNLLMNAIEAVSTCSGPNRSIRVRITRDSNEQGTLDIEDSGDGFPEEFMEQIFSPFVTNKPDGVGIGLYLAHEIAARCHGSLSYDRIGHLTRFRFRFPISRCRG